MSRSNGLPCTHCGTSDWYRNGNCKQCQSEYSRRYRQKNQQAVRERKQKYYRQNRDTERKKGQIYYQNNQEKIKANTRLYREGHPGKHIGYNRRYDQANPEKVAAKNHRRRTKKAGNGGSYTSQEWKDLCVYYDHRCLRCGKQEPKIKLTVDHVLPLDLGGPNNLDNLQPLCGSCNSWKGNRHIDFRNKPPMDRWLQSGLFG